MKASLEYYRVFSITARCGSLTEAARTMDISQPAVSQSLKQLESQLGVRLFNRSSRGVRLTPEGAILLDYIDRGFEQIDAGERKLGQMLDLDLGELSIGASDMTLEHYLLPYLQIFHQRYPGIKIKVSNAPTTEVIQHLESGTIDFGVVSGPLALGPGMESIPVRPIRDIFVAGHGYEQLRGRVISFAELADLPLIEMAANTRTRASFDHFLTANGISREPAFELASPHMIIQFALRDLGIGCVVEEFAQPYISQGQLFELQLEKPIPGRHFHVITQGRESLSVPASRLLELIGKEQS